MLAHYISYAQGSGLGYHKGRSFNMSAGDGYGNGHGNSQGGGSGSGFLLDPYSTPDDYSDGGKIPWRLTC